jgi:inward rectifier potassium channel
MHKYRAKMLRRLPRHTEGSGTLMLEKVGVSEFDLNDPYHLALTLTWPQFFLGLLVLYLAINLLFALLYFAAPGSVSNLPAGSLLNAFFFSIETLATVGYGNMAPITTYSHIVSTIEIVVGMLLTATMTGLVFVRFSKPRAKIIFATKAVVTRSGGRTRLMIRIGNGRMYALNDAVVRLTTLVTEIEPDGHRFRHPVDLKLVRHEMTFFPLTWTVVHEVTNDSPLALLRSANAQTLQEAGLRVMLSVTARDPSLGAQVHAAHAYNAHDIALDVRYVDAVNTLSESHAVADMRKIGETEPELSATGEPFAAPADGGSPSPELQP